MNQIPRLQFAHLPTPVEDLPRLPQALEVPIRLSIKRDDATGLALGGNKTRKLEYLVAEAQAHGARTLVTAGAAQSNHCRQTAAAAARFGFECILVLSESQTNLTRYESATGNILLDQLLGAEIIWTTRPERDVALQAAFQDAWQAGRRPYQIPYGGSSPVGAAAYAYAFLELVGQGAQPDWVVFASSSGGTQAGIAVGARLAGFRGRVLGISIDEEHDVLQQKVATLANETAELLGEKMTFTPEDIFVNADYLGGGYGVMGAAEMEAVRLFGRQEGILLDPVYTGRAAAGLIDLARKGLFKPGEDVLFWHTGGAPALFAPRYSELLQADH